MRDRRLSTTLKQVKTQKKGVPQPRTSPQAQGIQNQIVRSFSTVMPLLASLTLL
jgi:hypothetical protein